MNDFDFLVGSWNIANRRLTERLAGSDDWDEFPATSQVMPMFGGDVSVDEVTFPTKGFSGMSIRLFDRAREQWWIYWVDSRDGLLQPPVVGGFADDGVGRFHGDDTHEGREVRARFIWSEITPTSAHWEQAFSVDGEQTWETNWTMDLTRR